jgi:hypothetical protein
MDWLDPFTRFEDEFMNNSANPVFRVMWHDLRSFSGYATFWFRVIGCLTGLCYVLIRYQTPLLLVVYWGIFLIVFVFLKPFIEHVHYGSRKFREQLIYDALEAGCRCISFDRCIDFDRSINEVAIGIFADKMDKVLRCFPYGVDPSSKDNTDIIINLIELGKRIARSENQFDKAIHYFRSSEHFNSGT